MPVEAVDVGGIRCVVCLDEGCEWCPAVDPFGDEPAAPPPLPGRAA